MQENPFPTIVPWEEPVEGARLLDDLRDFVRQYLILPDHAAEVIALWIAHTYLLEAAHFTPYILVTSPVRECGKTTLLDLLLHLAHQAESTDSISASALYRRVEHRRPTLLLDELDTQLTGQGAERLRRVLNSGFKRHGRATISVGKEDQDFSTFCPKVLSGIGGVWDTVASRSIPIRLERGSDDELAALTKIEGETIGDICLPFRRKLRRFADDSLALLRMVKPVTPSGLSPRQGDGWRPLVAIASVTGGHWTVTATAAARALHRTAEEDGDSSVQLLYDLRTLFAEQQNPAWLQTQIIIQALVARDDRSWSEFGSTRGLTPRGLVLLLDPFKVRPKVSRQGGAQARGYFLADLRPAFARYLRVCESSVTSVTDGGVTAVTDNPHTHTMTNGEGNEGRLEVLVPSPAADSLEVTGEVDEGRLEVLLPDPATGSLETTARLEARAGAEVAARAGDPPPTGREGEIPIRA